MSAADLPIPDVPRVQAHTAQQDRGEIYVPVYALGARLSGLPTSSIPTGRADELVAAKVAKRVNHRTAIQLLKSAAPAMDRQRDLSANPGTYVTERSAQGSKYHQTLANAWKGSVSTNQQPANEGAR